MSPSVLLDEEPVPVRTIPLAYDSADSDNSARELIYALNPEWKQAEGAVEFVRFKDGITNTVCCTFPTSSEPSIILPPKILRPSEGLPRNIRDTD